MFLSPNLFTDMRREVFIRFCEEHSIDYQPYMKEGAFTVTSGYEMMSDLLQDAALPTAIFAASDLIAIGALKALNEHGLSVPEDISLMGFDNITMTEFTTPPLTTLHAPAYEMGNYGAIHSVPYPDSQKPGSYEDQTPLPPDRARVVQNTASLNILHTNEQKPCMDHSIRGFRHLEELKRI